MAQLPIAAEIIDEMNSEELLSICIPTFNRSEILKRNVLYLINEVRNFNLPILISDNNSSDDTARTVEFLKNEYQNIIYYKQEANISDLNFPFILSKASTKYAWLLGDKNRISSGAIAKVLKIIYNQSFDAVIVNCDPPRVKSFPTKIYSNPTELLDEIGWHTTMISTLIFSKEVIAKNIFLRYSNTKFMHVGGLFDAIADAKCNVSWLNEPYIQGPNFRVPNDWLKDVFPVFIDSWANSIMSLSPIYPVTVKLNCIKQHGINAKVFIFERFIYYRSKKIYNFQVFIKHFHHINLFTNVPRIILLFITILPSWFFGIMYYYLDKYRKIVSKENFR